MSVAPPQGELTRTRGSQYILAESASTVWRPNSGSIASRGQPGGVSPSNGLLMRRPDSSSSVKSSQEAVKGASSQLGRLSELSEGDMSRKEDRDDELRMRLKQQIPLLAGGRMTSGHPVGWEITSSKSFTNRPSAATPNASPSPRPSSSPGSDSDSPCSSSSSSSGSGSGSGYATITPSRLPRNRSSSRPNSNPASRSASRNDARRSSDLVLDQRALESQFESQGSWKGPRDDLHRSDGKVSPILIQRPRSYPRSMSSLASPSDPSHQLPLGDQGGRSPGSTAVMLQRPRSTPPASSGPSSPGITKRKVDLRMTSSSPGNVISAQDPLLGSVQQGRPSPNRTQGFHIALPRSRSRSDEHLPGIVMSMTASPPAPRSPTLTTTPMGSTITSRHPHAHISPASSPTSTAIPPRYTLAPGVPRPPHYPTPPDGDSTYTPAPSQPLRFHPSRFPQSEFTLYKNRTQNKQHGKSRSTPTSPKGSFRRSMGTGGQAVTPPLRKSHVRPDMDSGSEAGAETVTDPKRRRPRSTAVSPSETPLSGSPELTPVRPTYAAQRRLGQRSLDHTVLGVKDELTAPRIWSPLISTPAQMLHEAQYGNYAPWPRQPIPRYVRGISASSADDQCGSSVMSGSEGTFSEEDSVGASSALGLSFGMSVDELGSGGQDGNGGTRSGHQFGRGTITADAPSQTGAPSLLTRPAYSPSFQASQPAQSQALLHLRILAVVPALVGSITLLISVLWPDWQTGGSRAIHPADAIVCLPWAYVTASFCFELTTGLTHRWLLYYSYWPSCVRLVSLQAICWPCTALTVKYVGRYDILIAWIVVGTTTACSRSIQIWVTSNVPNSRGRLIIHEGRDSKTLNDQHADEDPIESSWKSSKQDAQIWMRQKTWDWHEISRLVGWRLASLYFLTSWYLLSMRHYGV